MAEFCLDCWNKTNGTCESERKYILSKGFELCEGCGEWKHVIIMEREESFMYKLSFLTIPIKIVCNIIWYLLTFPYSIIKHKNPKTKVR